MAFLHRVIGSVRGHREYVASIERLLTKERQSFMDQGVEAPDTDPGTCRVVDWWMENFSLISDAVTRGYPIRLVAYDELTRDPEGTLTDVFSWLGSGDAARAAELVSRERREQPAFDDAESNIDPKIIAVFDALYDRITRRAPLEPSFIKELNATNEKLAPHIAENMQKLRAFHARRKQAARSKPP